MKRILTALLISVALAANAAAISINSDRLLGYIETTGSASPSAELSYLQTLLNLYNNGGSSTGYTLQTGSLVPPPDLPLPSAYVEGANANQASVSIAIGLHEWVSLKSANYTGFYYIGDLAVGTHTLVNDVFKAGKSRNFSEISHYNFFGERTRVPESGLTLALLGLGLAAIGIFRHWRHR